MAAPIRGAGLIFQRTEVIEVGIVGRVRDDFGKSLLDQPGIDERITHIDIAQQSVKTVGLALILDEAHRLSADQRGVGGNRFLITGFVAFGRVHAHITHARGLTVQVHVNRIAINHAHHLPLFAIGCGRARHIGIKSIGTGGDYQDEEE